MASDTATELFCINESWLKPECVTLSRFGIALLTYDQPPDLKGVLSCCYALNGGLRLFYGDVIEHETSELERFDHDGPLHRIIIIPRGRYGLRAMPKPMYKPNCRKRVFFVEGISHLANVSRVYFS